MNPYLKAKRAQYEALRTTIEGFQTRAADENRDLTDDELRSVQEQGEQAKKIADEITSLTEIEQRSAKVAELGARVETETRSTGNTSAVDRDPGHYRSEADGGRYSFFSDMVRAKEYGDEDAVRRLAEHTRALSSSSAGTGIIPPKWLTDFAGSARQERRVANRVKHISLGNDPRPLVMPKQTGVTAVGVQSAENDTTNFPDAYNTGVDTLTPTTVVGGAKVSRQLLDASTPAVDELIYTDLLADYDTKVETRVVASMVTAAGTAVVAYATESAYTTAITQASGAVPFFKDLRKTATSVRNLRKLNPDIVIASVSRYGSWLDITDSTGRPIIVVPEYGPQNAQGVGSVTVDGRVLGLEVIATDGIAYQTYAESIVVARSQDTILAESTLQRFQYEQPDGPETVRLGVWGYVGALTRYAGKSTQRLQITAA